MLTSLIKVQSKIPNIGPENTSQWERKTAGSFGGCCTTSPLSMASLTPYCCPHNMGPWSYGGKENVPFLTFWPKQRHKNLSVHSAQHSQGRAGVSKPLCGKVWGHQKQARRPRALASVSHLSRLYSVFGKAASLLKKVGENCCGPSCVCTLMEIMRNNKGKNECNMFTFGIPEIFSVLQISTHIKDTFLPLRVSFKFKIHPNN